MAKAPILELYLLNFGFLAFLSLVFFKRKGKMTWGRFFSLLPFFFSVTYLIALSLGFSPTLLLPIEDPVRQMLAIPLSVASYILTSYSLGSHDRPVGLCHQDRDIPDHLVTRGAYSKIRHPLYTAHLLLLFGVFVFSPSIFSALLFLYGWAMLTFTAIKEERKFLLSSLGNQYREYMSHTGRFLPSLFGFKNG